MWILRLSWCLRPWCCSSCCLFSTFVVAVHFNCPKLLFRQNTMGRMEWNRLLDFKTRCYLISSHFTFFTLYHQLKHTINPIWLWQNVHLKSLFDSHGKETWNDKPIISCLNLQFDASKEYDKLNHFQILSQRVFIISILSLDWVLN